MINSKPSGRLIGSVADRIFGFGESRTAGVDVTRDLRLRLLDGAVLAADRYRPAEVERSPVVLIRTSYDRDSPMCRIYGHALARRGLQVVVQDVRGTFGSGTSTSPEDFEPFRHEHDDGLATIAWLREQPWCDGRIGMAGSSYLGYTQWAVAPYAEPRLSALALGVTASDFRPTFYPGGSHALELAASWSAFIGTQELQQPIWKQLGMRRRVAATMSALPATRTTLQAIGARVPFLAHTLEHAEPDDHYWDLLDHGSRLAELDTPTSMVAGWYDIFLSRQLGDFTALQQAGTQARITVGPWTHRSLMLAHVTMRDHVDWLSGILLEDRTILNRAPVRLYLQGAGRWLDFDQWPVPYRSEPFFLGADGRLGSEIPSVEGIRAFRYDPADPTPILGGAPLGGSGGQVDNRPVEARDDVLVYDTDPLKADLDVIGNSLAEIFVRTEHPDADVFVRVCDVEPGGRSLNVIEGLRRLRPTDAPRDDLGTRAVELELWPTAYRFRAGHRIRVQVSGGAFPNYIRNHQTREPIAEAVRTRPGRTQILHGPDHPTKINLAVYSAG